MRITDIINSVLGIGILLLGVYIISVSLIPDPIVINSVEPDGFRIVTQNEYAIMRVATILLGIIMAIGSISFILSESFIKEKR